MTRRERFVSCDECKPSAWKICPTCGRHVCQHRKGKCHDPAKRVVNGQVPKVYTMGASYSVMAETTRGRYSTQSSPGYYHAKDASDLMDAAKLAGLRAFMRRCPNMVIGRDWHGRRYSHDQGWYEIWIETTTDREREDRQRLRDKLVDVKMANIEAAANGRWGKESYQYKETFARYSGLL